MRHLRPYIALLAMAAVTAACSAAPGSGSGGENQPSTGSQPSQAAASSGSGGGGGSSDGQGGGSGGDFSHGSAKYHITGDYTADGELGFIPEASQFDNNGTWSLSFSDQANTVIVIILGSGIQTLSYGDEGHTVPGIQCDWNITSQDANGAAGSFQCNDQPLYSAAGTTTGSVDLTGEFTARK
jgi:hypothetical protein